MSKRSQPPHEEADRSKSKKQKLMQVIQQKETIEKELSSFDEKLQTFRGNLAKSSKEKLDAFMKQLNAHNDKMEKEFISKHGIEKKKKAYNEFITKNFLIQ